MRIHEQFGPRERKLQEPTAAWTQEEEEKASKLYAKYQYYRLCRDSESPLNPLPRGEMEYLLDVMSKMALQGKRLSLPNKTYRATNP